MASILFQENKKNRESMQWPADIIGAPMPGLIMPAMQDVHEYGLDHCMLML